MNKTKLTLIEIFIQSATAIITVITQPPLPLLAIPFIIITTTRTIMFTLEDKI